MIDANPRSPSYNHVSHFTVSAPICSLVFSPIDGGFLYGSSFLNNDVYIIDRGGGIDGIIPIPLHFPGPTGEFPSGLAVDPSNGNVYLATHLYDVEQLFRFVPISEGSATCNIGFAIILTFTRG